MCLGIPMKIIQIDGDTAKVELGGVEREIGLGLLEDIKIGDYVIVHAGFAIQKVDEESAQQTLKLIKEMLEK